MIFTLWLALAQAQDSGAAPVAAPVDPSVPVAAPVEPSAPVATPLPDPSRARRQAHSMKVAGTVLTSFGIATGALSTGLAVWGGAMDSTCTFECMGPVFAFGGAAIGAGITGVFLGAGVPLWVVGGKRERELSVPLSTMILVPTVEPQGGGVAMAFQF